jgi:hypothetical protein
MLALSSNAQFSRWLGKDYMKLVRGFWWGEDENKKEVQ